MKKLKFETKDVNGEKLELEVRLPTAQEKAKARVIHARVWREVANGGAILRDELDSFLKERGLWGQTQQDEYDRISKEIRDKVVTLQKGGNAGLTRKTGRALALEIRDLRGKMSEIVSKRNAADNNTAEAIADQAQFNYFISACTLQTSSAGVYAGKTYWSSYDNFVENSDADAAYDASMKFYELQNPREETKEEDLLPEIKFLRDNKFTNSEDKFIDSQGRLTDEEGRLINEKGRFINEEGQYVNLDNNLVDEAGNILVESAPLLDD
jgi:hypothetical protein